MATPCKHLADRVQQLPVSPRSLSAGSARLQMPPSRLLRPGHHKRPEVTAVKACCSAMHTQTCLWPLRAASAQAQPGQPTCGQRTAQAVGLASPLVMGSPACCAGVSLAGLGDSSAWSGAASSWKEETRLVAWLSALLGFLLGLTSKMVWPVRRVRYFTRLGLLDCGACSASWTGSEAAAAFWPFWALWLCWAFWLFWPIRALSVL
mmetsp:Transcript_47152/g.109013  ORF Transcript_47152/g.109013 Transcript_47152/m.109013 type:complete len:206 (-) Transcript_47152:92-709(-)